MLRGERNSYGSSIERCDDKLEVRVNFAVILRVKARPKRHFAPGNKFDR